MTEPTIQQLHRKYRDLNNRIIKLESKLGFFVDAKKSNNEVIDHIVFVVEKRCNVPEGSIFTKSRKGNIPLARKMALVVSDRRVRFQRFELALIFHVSESYCTQAHRSLCNVLKYESCNRDRFHAIIEELGMKVEDFKYLLK